MKSGNGAKMGGCFTMRVGVADTRLAAVKPSKENRQIER
jgi:hypothetical protein